MFPFLKAVARWISSHFPESTDQLIIVLPTRRSGHFLKQYLSDYYSKAVWAPEILTINEWISADSSRRIAESPETLFDLYLIYKQVQPNYVSLDEFIQWGEIILNDFDEIDKNLIDASQLFRNIIDYQELQSDFSYLTENQIQAIRQFHHHFNPSKESDIKHKIKQLWELLPELYTLFNEKLEQKKCWYEGRAYRHFAEHIQENLQDGKQYLFIGFNALVESEKKIFRAAQNRGNAAFFWDYDIYYQTDFHHDAGKFIRENLIQFPAPDDFTDDADNQAANGFQSLLSQPKQFHQYKVSSVSGQTALCGKIVQQELGDYRGEADYMAIVLPDESLLPSLLHQLPPSIKDLNISMGYPLRYSLPGMLLNQIHQVHKTTRLKSDGTHSSLKSGVLSLLNHDYLKPYAQETLKILNKSERYRVAGQQLDALPEPLRAILEPPQEGIQLLKQLRLLLEWLIQDEARHLPDVEKEFTFQLYLLVQKLENLVEPLHDELIPESTYRLLHRMIRTAKIPFKGEPLKGIQLVGLLETRLIDFQKVILISFNEGAYPPSGFTPSFIPYSIRTGFNLANHEKRDAMYAYYFYRLMQRPQQVHFLIPEGIAAGNKTEASRYLAQLSFSNKFSINSYLIDNDININQKTSLSIQKQVDMFAHFRMDNTDYPRKLTPTALNAFIDCGLKFYFRYILQLKPPIEKSESIDALEFGNILHYFMKLVYEDHPEVDASYPESILKDGELIQKLLLRSFEEYGFANQGIIETPENELLFENMLLYVRELLKADANYAPFQVIATEEEMEQSFQVKHYPGQNFRLGGNVDRIDEKMGRVRIIDYKTGRDSNEIKTITELFDGESEKREKAAFQVFLYSEFYMQANPTFRGVLEGHILNVKQLFKKNPESCIQLKGEAVNYNSIRPEFQDQFSQLLDTIFDPALPFEQTKNEKKCEYCDYNTICKR